MTSYASITIPYLLWLLGVMPLSGVYSYFRVRSGKPLAPKNRRYRAMILMQLLIVFVTLEVAKTNGTALFAGNWPAVWIWVVGGLYLGLIALRPACATIRAGITTAGVRDINAKHAPIGACGEAQETVAFEHTLTAHHASLPPVYSTPDMIRLVETAAFHALQPYCEGDEISVGTSIHIEHRAASGIGSVIKAEAVVECFDGRFYIVRVSAKDGAQEIGRGTVGRAIVSVATFLERIKKQK